MSESTLVICGECGVGNYTHNGKVLDWACLECGHELAWSDLEPNLGEGEHFATVGNVLTVVSAS